MISIRSSLADLVSDGTAMSQSPKRKFNFRFPNLVHHSNSAEKIQNQSTDQNGAQHKTPSNSNRNGNFSDEVKNVPDLQVIIVNFISNSFSLLHIVVSLTKWIFN